MNQHEKKIDCHHCLRPGAYSVPHCLRVKGSGRRRCAPAHALRHPGPRTAAAKRRAGQIADYLLKAAAGRTELTRDGLLEKLNAEEGDQANRVQALVMISRAFGSLPAAAQPGDVDLSGVPDWALADLENLKNSGVLTSGELAGSEEDNRKFLEGDGTDLSAGEQVGDFQPDDTKDSNNGDFGVILGDEDLSDYEDNKVEVEGPGCPIGGGSPDNPDLTADVVVPTLTIRSTIPLSDVETVVNRILALI